MNKFWGVHDSFWSYWHWSCVSEPHDAYSHAFGNGSMCYYFGDNSFGGNRRTSSVFHQSPLPQGEGFAQPVKQGTSGVLIKPSSE